MNKIIKTFFIFFTFVLFVSISQDCFATDIFDTVLQKYKDASITWASTIQRYALRLFMSLAVISFVWTMGKLALQKTSFNDVFGEAVRFCIFIGFFLWLLQNSTNFANDIIDSMRQMGGEASGKGQALSPSGIVDIGMNIVVDASKGFSFWSIGTTIMTGSVALIVFILLSLIGINMLLQICSAWILAYAGIFFLGFGGSRWTSDIAINYFKTVLSIGASLMTMTLLVGLGEQIITDYYKSFNTQPPEFGELISILVFCLTLFMLVDKVPSMVAGIITGSSIGQSSSSALGGAAAFGMGMLAAKMATPSVSKATGSALSAVGNKAFSNLTGGQGKGGTGGNQGGSGLSAMGINPKNSRPSS